MRKPRSLRQHLLDAPGLDLQPDRLMVYLDQGSVTAVLDPADLSYRTSYQAIVILTDFVGDPNVVFFTVLQWLAENEPGIAEEVFQYEADILDRDRVDLRFMIPLTERVNHKIVDGGSTLTSVEVMPTHAMTLPGLKDAPDEEAESDEAS